MDEPNNTVPWTTGEFVPEKDKPTYNPGANAYQRAILSLDKSRIIPGFAFGETEKECKHNAWLMSASKELLTSVQLFLKNDPNAKSIGEKAMYKAMGHLEKP